MSTKYMPDELVVEILKRLPAKLLLRFMSVCESWYSLIKSPNFISYHFNHQINREPNYLMYRNWDSLGYDVYSDNENFDLHRKFNYYKDALRCSRVACCNGILCLMNNPYHKVKDVSFVLWNSSIRKSFDLKVPHSPRSVGKNSACWFGFDVVSYEYKLVWFAYSRHASNETRSYGVYIYSLNERDWRCVNSSFSLNIDSLDLRGLYLNGVIHWVAYKCYGDRYMPEAILTFRLEDETFGVCNLPSGVVYVAHVGEDDYFRPKHNVNLIIVKRDCKNCLAVIHDDMTKLDFWVMEEEGKQESWIKDFSMYSGRDTRILNARMNGDIVMAPESGGVVSLDQRLTRMNPLSSKHLEYAGTYMESLVLLL